MVLTALFELVADPGLTLRTVPHGVFSNVRHRRASWRRSRPVVNDADPQTRHVGPVGEVPEAGRDPQR